MQIILFCSQHTAALRSYLEAPNSRWSHHVIATAAGTTATTGIHGGATAIPRIRLLTSPNVASAGDALRALDNMAVVRSDPFLLVDGCVVSNAHLASAIAAHAARAKEDANAILTVVLRPSAPPSAVVATSGLLPRHPAIQPAREALAVTLNATPDDGKIWAFVSLPRARSCVAIAPLHSLRWQPANGFHRPLPSVAPSTLAEHIPLLAGRA